MNKEEKIKYLDIIISNIEDVDLFIPYNILSKKTKIEEPELGNIEHSVRQFALTYELFEKNGTGSYFRLTPKGNDLKDSKKGFIKFLKMGNKKPWYNENWVGYLIAFIVFLFTVYQHFENRTLSNQVYILNKKNDSLNIQIETYKNQFFELKESIEKNKEQGK